MHSAKILLIYTGGTIGMIKNREGFLEPISQQKLLDYLPEISRLTAEVSCISTSYIKDSSEIDKEDWLELAQLIQSNYSKYDGFVVLHGTDTMTYTSSALSFMLEGLIKPIIFTGSQLPIGVVRSDARENLTTAIEITAHQTDGEPTVQEVAIFFENELLRANRSIKNHTENFDAFISPNFPALANSGVELRFNYDKLLRPLKKELSISTRLLNEIGLLIEHPEISDAIYSSYFNIQHHKVVVIETYGMGNINLSVHKSNCIKNYINQGGLVVAISQCNYGEINFSKYKTGSQLSKLGVLNGGNHTRFSILTKLITRFYDFGNQDIAELIESSVSGEIN